MTNDLELTAYAATIEIKTEQDIQGSEWEKKLVGFFDLLAALCKKRGVQAIGHIKGFVQLLNNAGYCYFSTTGSSKGTGIDGQLHGVSSRGKLDFNILVYGIDDVAVEQIAKEAIQTLEKDMAASCTISSLENPAKK